MSMDHKQYLVGVGLDISERKQLEDQFRQAQKMASIGTLAGGIAHDFNNILTAIIGYGNLLNMKMPIDGPLRHHVDQILSSANRAAQLTQDLLADSRKQIINPQPVNLKEGRETILVADDDEAFRGLAKDMLEEFGYAVILAEDGEDALNKFRENGDKIQLLLFDVIMPKKNGKEVYEEIRGMNPAVKAIFLSGYAADRMHREGVLEKGLNFIVKPFVVNTLLDEVRRVLDS
jgi:CheY-like chemotaxis protein